MNKIFVIGRGKSLIWLKRRVQNPSALENPELVTLWPHFVVAFNEAIILSRSTTKVSSALVYPFGQVNIRPPRPDQNHFNAIRDSLGIISDCDIKNLWPRFTFTNVIGDFAINADAVVSAIENDTSVQSIHHFAESCVLPSKGIPKKIVQQASGLTAAEVDKLWDQGKPGAEATLGSLN